MQTTIIKIEYKQCPNIDLSVDDGILYDSALIAANNAYAPYSGFHVGAAVLLENGQIVTGCNQENAAYPSGLCAERVALFSAGAQFPGTAVLALAVIAVYKDEVTATISPCGSCCQVLREFEQLSGRGIRILLCGKDETRILDSVSSLLPFSFDSSSFGNEK